MTWQCLKCDMPIGMQLAVCDHCSTIRTSRLGSDAPFRFRYSTRTLLLTMTALAPTFMLSQKLWEQILSAAAIGAIATGVGIFLTRMLIDGAYRVYGGIVRRDK